MHIVLGLLGTIVTILILLNRLAEAGIDLGGLNPFLWSRRRKWRNKYEGNPVHCIENPMDATAILMVAVAKADGDISKEEKSLLLQLFEDEFNLDKKDAAGLLISSAHLLGDGTDVRDNIEKFLQASKEGFSEDKAASAIDLISRVAGNPEERHINAIELMKKLEKCMKPEAKNNSTW